MTKPSKTATINNTIIANITPSGSRTINLLTDFNAYKTSEE
ncbi:12659_t:CDS:2 [Funneliformis geosporum]|uniref:12659_t:CDS:1 n=1 Tax=Funneliformis geosporum TaxID=1117311 RepID=A0A9W4WWJ8_9GLOM|nr:12659_t:CDS:2 [Funneliformis geosporum]